MKIVFNPPPVLDSTGNRSSTPINDFNPSDKKHYPSEKLGVYINGVRLTLNNTKVFVPAYVGIVHKGSLEKRLYNHHYTNYRLCLKKQGKGNKEIWDFDSVYSLKEIENIYSEMHYYDHINKNRKGVDRTSEEYLRKLLSLKYLIFFQNKNYFEMKNGGLYSILDSKSREINHCDAIKLGYDKEHKINNTKMIYDIDFYFAYCSHEEILKGMDDNEKEKIGDVKNSKLLLERVEYATKKALNLIGIHTTAKAEGVCLDMDIDLTNVENHLVNLGCHPFNVNLNYQNLIVKVRS